MHAPPWRPPFVALILLAVTALTGCLEPGGDGGPGGDGEPAAPYRLHGAFTENATQEEMAELGARARAHGSDMVLMESYPVQFAAGDLPGGACEDLRAYAASREYVRSVGECTPQTAGSGDPDGTVTNDAEG